MGDVLIYSVAEPEESKLFGATGAITSVPAPRLRSRNSVVFSAHVLYFQTIFILLVPVPVLFIIVSAL